MAGLPGQQKTRDAMHMTMPIRLGGLSATVETTLRVVDSPRGTWWLRYGVFKGAGLACANNS
ncbi:MAG TPA: hypothetical protein VF278_25455, partial [Pirellulales bacterium]